MALSARIDNYPGFEEGVDGYTLARKMKEQFGEKAGPLYDRLVKYMQILHNNEFILFVGKDKVKP